MAPMMPPMGGPMPPDPMMGMDPMMGAMGAPPVAGDPSMGMMPPGDPSMMGMGPMPPSPFPSTDPSVVGQILMLLSGMREQDHAALEMQQDEVLSSLMAAMGIGGVDPMSGFAEGGMPPMAMDEGVPPSTPIF